MFVYIVRSIFSITYLVRVNVQKKRIKKNHRSQGKKRRVTMTISSCRPQAPHMGTVAISAVKSVNQPVDPEKDD